MVVIALMVLIIMALVEACERLRIPEPPPIEPYIQTPEEREWVKKRMRYHGLGMNGVEVMKEIDGHWHFYRDGQWIRL